MQSQRAKLEQEQRAIQQMSPEEAYQNRLRRHKHDALRRTVMSIVAVAAIATVVLLYVERRSYHNYRILSASEQEDVVSTKYLEMSGKILRYSPDGASLVSDTMDAYWSTLYEMQNPVADVKDDRAVIADQDGTLLEMFDKNGETGSVTTSYNIVKARISSSGMVAAILDGGDSTWINFYASDGSLIAENQTHISDPGYPLDVAVADNGNIMMVAYQYVDGSETTSYVAFYNFGDVGQSEDDRIVSGYTYEGTVIPQIIMSFIARAKFKFNYLSILGIMSGSYTDPPALAYSNKVANNDAPAVAYSTVYPLSMFMRVITAQLVVLIFG